ncbi:MAG: efflux RND transporter periplasmic adaptor subunit [Bacteroidetes bacterium]|nr:efflux RND transporter periplasmic adaptor subunit [Bacteroidota bacterium]
MKKKIIIISTILLLLVILVLIFKDKGNKVLKVSVAKAEKRTIIEVISANGKVQPETEVSISTDVSGEIIEIFVHEGDTVKEGQILLKIKPDIYISAVDRANAILNSATASKKIDEVLLIQAQSRLDEAAAAFNRAKDLYSKKVISTAEFEKTQTAYKVALADVEQIKEKIKSSEYSIDNASASLKEARQNLDRTIITAPTDGVVSKINNKKGERVVGTAQMQGTEIMRISNFSNVEVRVDINENDILKIHKNDSAIIEIDAYNERKFKGIVTQIAKSSNKASSALSTDQVTTFEVKIRILKNSYTDLLAKHSIPFLPGLSANVDIQTNRGNELVSLPIECVTTRTNTKNNINSEQEEVVFLIKKDKVVKQKVKTGIQDNSYIQIISGIKIGEQAVSGPYNVLSTTLDNDRKVKVVEKEKLFESNN